MTIGQMNFAEIAAQHKPGDEWETDGLRYKMAKNGSIYNLGVAGARFVYGVPPEETRITTSEHAQRMNEIRWHGHRQDAARQAVRDALNDDKIDSIEAADGYMTYALVREGVLDGTQRLADRVKAYETVLEHSGMSGKAPKQAQQQVQGATLSMDTETAVAVAQAVAAEMSKRGIVDG